MANTYTITGITAGIKQAMEFGKPKDGASALLLRIPDSGSDVPAEFEIGNPADKAKLKAADEGLPITIHGNMDARFSAKQNRVYVGPGKITRIELTNVQPPEPGNKK